MGVSANRSANAGGPLVRFLVQENIPKHKFFFLKKFSLREKNAQCTLSIGID